MRLGFWLVLLGGTLLAAGCGHAAKGGENCTADADCGSGYRCIEVFNAAPTCHAPASKTCEHACTSDADCAGTSDVFGATPACGSDCNGSRFCVPQL